MTAAVNKVLTLGSLTLLLACALAACSRPADSAPKTSTESKDSQKHILTLGVREDGKLIFAYEGTGQAVGIGWTKTSQKDFNLTFDGMHLPPGAPYSLGDTNHLDAFLSGKASFQGTNDEFLVCDLKANTKVPLEVKFLGISDTSKKPATNETDASLVFEVGQHDLHFKGEIISVFESKK